MTLDVKLDAPIDEGVATRLSFDAVRHLLLCRIEQRPPRLDMENYPHLPMAQVRTTQTADYMTLLAEACA